MAFVQTHYKESKYGAFVFDGGWNGEPQPNDTLAYTFLQNTTSYHATGIFVNVSGPRAVCVCVSS